MEDDKSSSPYLTAIQSIPGTCPGAKYKHLNALVKTHVESYKKSIYQDVDITLKKELGALHSFVTVRIVDELQLASVMGEALKYEDARVVNKALRAKWFFQGDKSHVDPEYYRSNILPSTSLRTIRKIVKNLSYSLAGSEAKAASFFELFREQYGPELAKPLILCCEPDYAFKAILRYKFVLSKKQLALLYRRQPRLVLRYAELHKMNLPCDRSIVSRLFSDYPEDFAKMARAAKISVDDLVLTRSQIRNLAKNNANFIVYNAKYVMARDSSSCLVRRLSRSDFEQVYFNLLPRNPEEFDLGDCIALLKYYPREARWELMKSTYERKYGTEFLYSESFCEVDLSCLGDPECSKLLTDEQFEVLYQIAFSRIWYKYNFDEMLLYSKSQPKEKRLDLLTRNYSQNHKLDLFQDVHFTFFKSEDLLMLLPKDKRFSIVCKLIGLYKKNSEKYLKYCYYLPTDETFEIFKEAIESWDSMEKRRLVLKNIMRSYKLHNDQTGLSKFLEHYKSQNRCDARVLFVDVVDCLMEEFKIEDLDDSCWGKVYGMTMKVLVKKGFFTPYDVNLVSNFCIGTMRRLIKSKEKMSMDDFEDTINCVAKFYLQYQVEALLKPGYPAQLELEILDRLLLVIEREYPNGHKVWEKSNRQQGYASEFLTRLRVYNEKMRNSRDKEERRKIARIDEYPWLKAFVTGELLISKRYYELDKPFVDLVKQVDKEYYVKTIFESKQSYKESILTGKACVQLTRDLAEVTENWQSYLSACQDLLCSSTKSEVSAAKKFLSRVKWCNKLPLLFVKQCERDINEASSPMVLAILQDGETFGEFFSPIITEKISEDVNEMKRSENFELISSIAAAIKSNEPPVTWELLKSLFPEDDLAKRSILNYSCRVEWPKAMALIELLIDQTSILLKHQSVLLAFQVAPSDELHRYLRLIWCENRQPTVAGVLARQVHRRFVADPSASNWLLVKTCIEGLRINSSRAMLKVFSNTNELPKEYAAEFIKTLLDRLEELAGDDFANHHWKEQWIVEILGKVPESLGLALPKETVIEILKRYYFKAESVKIAEAVGDFTKSLFNRSKLCKAVS